jgi:hypothetical protein
VGKKVRTTLTIDRDVLKTAMEIGINVSQFCENCLREAIQKLKSPRTEPNGGSASFSLSSGSLFGKEKVRWAGPDLNRRPLARKANVLTKLDDRPPKLAYFF